MKGFPRGFNGDGDMQDASMNLLLQSAVELIPSKTLRDNEEAMCEMLESLANPQPEPVWAKYGEVGIET